MASWRWGRGRAVCALALGALAIRAGAGAASAAAAAPPATAAAGTEVPAPAATQPASRPRPSSPVRISGVLFEGSLPGRPEPDEAVRLHNSDPAAAAEVGGFRLSDRFLPRPPAGDRSGIALPAAVTIPPGGEIWIAFSARGFERVFGFKPAFEAQESDTAVPNVAHVDQWPRLAASYGVLSLHAGDGEVIDLVAYDARPEPALSLARVPDSAWSGDAVALFGQTPQPWRGQILARDRDAAGSPLPDTDRALDWDSGFSQQQLGVDPTHRVERPGQTRFAPAPLYDVDARVLCASSPENSFETLAQAIDAAERSILLSAYRFSNQQLAEHLVRARQRGVAVTVRAEGAPAGGLVDESRVLLSRLHEAGVEVVLRLPDQAQGLGARYRFDHSAYALIDDRLAVIGSENPGRAGHPPDPSFGNRGFEVQIEQAELVRQLRAAWDADLAGGSAHDVVRVGVDARADALLRPRDPQFAQEPAVQKGSYERRRQPLRVEGRADLGLVLSPDNSLDEQGALLGLIASAEKELLVAQNAIPRSWGGAAAAAERSPNLALEAVLAAARRGVATRVLVDGSWYHIEATDPRDNDDTVAYLNRVARREELDLQAKVINLASTHLEKLHGKAVIVDGARVFVGSLNWSESSFKANREVGVVIGQRKVAGYFRDLFWEDWRASRLYRADVEVPLATVWRDGKRRGGRLSPLRRGTRVWVIGEVGRQGKGPAALEIVHPRGGVGYISRSVVGEPIVAPRETPLHLGRKVQVEGRVLHAEVDRRGVRLCFTHGRGFAGIIFRHHIERFLAAGVNPETTYTGKDVLLHGVLRPYGAPEIVLKSPRQIEIVNAR